MGRLPLRPLRGFPLERIEVQECPALEGRVPSLANLYCTLKVDANVEKNCPSGEIWVGTTREDCVQDVVVPKNPATFKNEQKMSASSYSGSPLQKCFYSDSYIDFKLYYWDIEQGSQPTSVAELAAAATTIAKAYREICVIKFHEPNSTSFKLSGVDYPDKPKPPAYDILVAADPSAGRDARFTITVRAPSTGDAGTRRDDEVVRAR